MTDTSAIESTASGVRTISVNGHQLGVLGPIGDGGTNVVFVHGITGDVEFWDDQIPQDLRGECRWAAISLPCHYPSTPPDTFASRDITPEMFADTIGAAIRELFGGNRVHLVGWSTGGFSSLVVAARHPDLVASVTSISGFARGKWGNSLGMMQRIARLGLPGRLVFRYCFWSLSWYSYAFRIVFAGLGARGVGANPLFTSGLKTMQSRFARLNFGHMALLFGRLSGIDTSSLIRNVVAPTLVIGGVDDTIIPIQETRYVASLLGSHELEEIPDCGHLFYCEAPDQIWPRVTEWIQQHNV